jgi:catechol 2,3-dioxygenase-like lactoylglutathione lyase family enzyme
VKRKTRLNGMSRYSIAGVVLIVVAIAANGAAQSGSDANDERAIALDTTAPVLWQPSMNVFRRFVAAPEKMYEFYGAVLGFKQLATLNVNGTGGGVARFQAGAQELKLTRRVDSRKYVPGGVTDATGLRLLTFFFDDEAALARRFEVHGYAAPAFAPLAGSPRRSALVTDPDGQAVELVVLSRARPEELQAIEVGLTVGDLNRSRAFYRGFVGLEELPPAIDPRYGTMKYPFRHGATTITLRSFGRPLPADTGSGGIQYVVSNVDAVAALAAERHITIDQPLSGLPNFALRTIWLDDPDGITNYFAETAQSRAARHAPTPQP